jgi:protoporphyrinogen oxidase
MRPSSEIPSFDCVVVGAGPAGLAAASWLKKHNVETIVFEAEAEVGGRTGTLRIQNVLMNKGASFFATFYSETIEVARQAGVEMIPPKIHPGRDGKEHQLHTPGGLIAHRLSSLRGLMSFPLMSLPDKLRAITVLISLVLGRKIHIADPRSLAPFDNESAEAWGLRVFGKNAHEYLVRISLEPYFYFDADEASCAFSRALLRHATHWAPLIPAGGVGTFCARLAKGLNVQCGTAVHEIRRDGAGFLVRNSHGDVRAETVVLAIPADKALTIEAPVSSEDREDLASVRYVPCVRALLGYNRGAAPPIPYITPAGPGKHALMSVSRLASWEAGRVPEGQEVIWISASGWRGSELARREPKEIIEALVHDCAAIGVVLPPPQWAETVINWQGMVVPGPGHFRRTAAFLDRERRGIFFAGDWLTGSTVEGAVRTGHEAARRVVASIAH